MPTKFATAQLIDAESGAVFDSFRVEVIVTAGDQPSVTVRASLPGVRADLSDKQCKMRLAGVTDVVKTEIKVDPSGPSTACKIYLVGPSWRATDWTANL